MNQLNLDFAPQPRTHASDPLSSHVAETRIRSTMRPKHRDLLDALAAHPGATATDIAERFLNPFYADWPLGKHELLCEVRKRLSDLRTAPVPRVRRVHVSGERESRWFVA